MNTLETLKAARKLITPRRAWIKNALAETRAGHDVDPWLPEACRWCSAGAIVAVCGGFSRAHHDAIDLLEAHIGEYIGVWNDRRTHKQVLAAFDEAIARLSDACKQVTR